MKLFQESKKVTFNFVYEESWCDHDDENIDLIFYVEKVVTTFIDDFVEKFESSSKVEDVEKVGELCIDLLNYEEGFIDFASINFVSSDLADLSATELYNVDWKIQTRNW